MTIVQQSFPSFEIGAALSSRLGALPPNPITAAMVEAAQLRRQGHKVSDFSIGEPDFDTPHNIQDAAIAAMRIGQTRYTPTDGTPELKLAICRKFDRDNGLKYEPGQITVGSGAKHVIFNALQATLDPGDEVIVAAPYWTTYPEAIRLCGGVPVIVACSREDGFKLKPGQIAEALSPRTKWVLLNSPSNPTGATYNRDELRSIAEVILGHPRTMVLSDDIYEEFIYTKEPFATIANVVPALYDRTLTVNGVSKTYAMTGWRIGYAGGPARLIRAIANIQSQATSNPCSISQAAAIEALSGPQDIVAERLEVFRKRRDLVTQLINRTPGLSCDPPEGAFYVYVDCSAQIGRKTKSGSTIASDLDFAQYLLRDYHVSVVHGAAFGLSPCFRMSYAAAEDEIVEGCLRIHNACGALQ